MARIVVILFAFLAACNVLLSGSAGGGVICLGGGHTHKVAERGMCGLAACSHSSRILAPHHPGHDHGHCHCTDIPPSGPAVLTTLRPDGHTTEAGPMLERGDWSCFTSGDLAGRCTQPRAPPGFDAGREHRLGVVASVRLII